MTQDQELIITEQDVKPHLNEGEEILEIFGPTNQLLEKIRGLNKYVKNNGGGGKSRRQSMVDFKPLVSDKQGAVNPLLVCFLGPCYTMKLDENNEKYFSNKVVVLTNQGVLVVTRMKPGFDYMCCGILKRKEQAYGEQGVVTHEYKHVKSVMSHGKYHLEVVFSKTKHVFYTENASEAREKFESVLGKQNA